MISIPVKKRINVCLVLVAILALPVIIRLFYLQTIRHEELTTDASKEYKRTVAEIGPRGRIFDSEGNLLAESIVTWNCSLLKKEFPEPGKNIPLLAATLSIPKRELQNRFNTAKNYLVVKKGLVKTQAEAIKTLKIAGLKLEPIQTRYYPSGGLAGNILGIAASDRGLTGIELLYDKELSGKVSRREVFRDSGGKTIYRGEQKAEAAPMDVYLTLDKNIQFFAQESIKKYGQKNVSDLALALVQDPNTGKLLALATYPENPVKIQPVEWVYEPGSTFKAVTIAAALEKNVVKETDTFYCENGSWPLNSKVTIHDHEPEQTLSLSGVLERSSNIGTAKIALKLGLENFYLYTKAFGFGAKTGIGFRGESSGIIKPMEKYAQVDLAVGAYGHGIAATPLQVLNAYSVFANGGKLLEPQLVDKITQSNGETFSAGKVSAIRQVITSTTCERIKKMLIQAVETGTGKNAAITGYSIAGKTGTSMKIDPVTGKYIEKKNVASFCGFFPANNPRYTILVILDNPKVFHYGGETAAPAFQEIAKKIITLKGIRADKMQTRTDPAPTRDRER